MRKLYFKPMPVLSILLCAGVAILIGLGVWQYQRLAWKTDLLAEVEASVSAPPLSSLKALNNAISVGEPIDFRRIEFTAKPLKDAPVFHLYKSQTGGIVWDVIEPLSSGEMTIFANTLTLTDIQKDVFKPEHAVTIQKFTGYVRKIYPMGKIESWVKSKPSPDLNRYFHFNQTNDWYDGLPPSSIKGYYIDIEPSDTAEALPIRRPDIRNNHFSYMLTWWSFAFIFIVIYLILHRRAGRLKFQ